MKNYNIANIKADKRRKELKQLKTDNKENL